MKKIIVTLSLLVLWLSHNVSASVVMLNTRVIYPSQFQSQTIQFTNNDATPYVMQLWMDDNNPHSTPESADSPFVVMPAIFRIEPHIGQSVRLVYSGEDLPKDRESVFYLNSAQVPPKNVLSNAENQMVVVLRNRVKVFYRPEGILGSPDGMPKELKFSINRDSKNWILHVKNPTGYYASIVKLKVELNNGKFAEFPTEMIPPQSELSFKRELSALDLSSAVGVKFTLVNDHGGYTDNLYKLSK